MTRGSLDEYVVRCGRFVEHKEPGRPGGEVRAITDTSTFIAPTSPARAAPRQGGGYEQSQDKRNERHRNRHVHSQNGPAPVG